MKDKTIKMGESKLILSYDEKTKLISVDLGDLGDVHCYVAGDVNAGVRGDIYGTIDGCIKGHVKGIGCNNDSHFDCD